jgi:hypothetical protein
MAQVETKLGRVQNVAGEGVVDSSIKAQQLQYGLSQLSTSLASFGKTSEKRRIQNDIITARTAFALNQEMPGSLAPEAEIAFNDMVAIKSTNQFFRLLSDDAEVFGNQVLIDDEVYPDHNTKQAAFEDFIDKSKETFFTQAQFNDAQQGSILASVFEKVGKLKDSFSILAAKDIKALKLNETAAFVQESIINVADSSKPFDRTWHEDLKKTIAKANPHLNQDELDDLIVDQIGLLATDPNDPHPEYLEYFTEPGKRGKPALSIIPKLSQKARNLYVTARSNFITNQKATAAAEVKYEKEQEQLAYDKAQSYIVEEVGDIENGQRDLLKLHADVRKSFPKISPTHLKAVINYANTLITASANEGDAELTITLKQQASLGTLSLDDLTSHPLKKTLSQKQLVSIHEQILRYSQGKVTEKQNNINDESKSFRDQLIIGIQTDKNVVFNGKQYSLRKGDRIAFNPITNRMEGLSAINSFAVDSLVNEYIRRADNVLLDEHNATASDVRRELAKLKNEMMSDAGLLAKQDQPEVYENVAKPNPYKVPTTQELFDSLVGEEEDSDSSVIVTKTPVPKTYNPTIHLPPNKELTMGAVLQKDLRDKNIAIQDAILGSPKATEPNTPKTEASSSTLSVPEQRKEAFDKAAPDVPNERSTLRNLQDDAKFQSEKTIMDLIKDLTVSKEVSNETPNETINTPSSPTVGVPAGKVVEPAATSTPAVLTEEKDEANLRFLEGEVSKMKRKNSTIRSLGTVILKGANSILEAITGDVEGAEVPDMPLVKGPLSKAALFGANHYNASPGTEERTTWATNADRGIKSYRNNALTKQEQFNVTQMLSTLSKAKSSFVDDLRVVGLTFDQFKELMVGVYSAETAFGLSKSKISKTNVVGELQVTRGTFRDVSKPRGNFGPLMAKAVGFKSIQEIRNLSDKQLKDKLLNDNKFNYIAGAAVMLNKLQTANKDFN